MHKKSFTCNNKQIFKKKWIDKKSFTCENKKVREYMDKNWMYK